MAKYIIKKEWSKEYKTYRFYAYSVIEGEERYMERTSGSTEEDCEQLLREEVEARSKEPVIVKELEL